MKTKRKTTAAPSNVVRTTRFSSMTPAEQEAEYRSVDRAFDPAEWKPLTVADRAAIAAAKKAGAAKRRPGRPATGVTTKSVLVSVDRQLLEEADAFAERNGLKRTQMVAAGLRLVMAGGSK